LAITPPAETNKPPTATTSGCGPAPSASQVVAVNTTSPNPGFCSPGFQANSHAEKHGWTATMAKTKNASTQILPPEFILPELLLISRPFHAIKLETFSIYAFPDYTLYYPALQ
jgi:hypothetical protein